MAIAKEQLRQIIKENDIQNVGDIYNLLKDSFYNSVGTIIIAGKPIFIQEVGCGQRPRLLTMLKIYNH